MNLNKKEYDVVVVGAGPIGSTAARYAAKNGASVLMVEDHGSIGSPVGCTGLLSTRALSECDVEPSETFVLNKVRGAFVHPMNGEELPIDGKETKAYVVSRKIFDRTLANMAAKEGVEISLKTRATGIEKNIREQYVQISQEGVERKIRTKVIIAADGVRSNIAKIAGLGQVDKVLSGIQIEGAYQSHDTDFVELFVGSQAPGFFAWTVPVSEEISRIGLAIDAGQKSAQECLENLLKTNKHLSSRYNGGNLDIVMGGIPIGPLDNTYSDGVLIVGDAAGQVKPTSGGGIYTGAICAKIAGEVAAMAALENDTTAMRLSEYDRRWRAEIGKELALGMRIHKFIGGLKDEEMDELINSMNEPQILDTITKYGDMDHPSILIKKLLNPANSRSLFRIFRAFAKSVL